MIIMSMLDTHCLKSQHRKHETVNLSILAGLAGHHTVRTWRKIYRQTQLRHVHEWVPVCACTHEHTHS